MRIWDYRLLPYLPNAQFKGQLRELVAIGKDLLKKGKTNHILIIGVLSNNTATYPPFKDWHDKEYLRICMSNLLEKHRGIGKSRITDEEWARLCEGYEQITGEPYAI